MVTAGLFICALGVIGTGLAFYKGRTIKGITQLQEKMLTIAVMLSLLVIISGGALTTVGQRGIIIRNLQRDARACIVEGYYPYPVDRNTIVCIKSLEEAR